MIIIRGYDSCILNFMNFSILYNNAKIHVVLLISNKIIFLYHQLKDYFLEITLLLVLFNSITLNLLFFLAFLLKLEFPINCYKTIFISSTFSVY